MPVRFPETETKTPTYIYRGHQDRQDRQERHDLHRHDLQGRHRHDRHREDIQDRDHHSRRDQDGPDQDSDSDLIFDFEMEDSSGTPGQVNPQDMDPEEYIASLTQPTTADLELFLSLRSATNAQGPSEQSDQGTTPQDSQDPPASPESAPVQRYQPVRAPFLSHSSGPGNATSSRTPTLASALRGGSHPARSRAAYSPLAPHAHQLHQGHRYVTGRGFGSPGWNPTSGSYGGTRNGSSNSRSSDSQRRVNHGNQLRQSQNNQSGQNSQQFGSSYQAWQTQPLQNGPAWPALQQPPQPPQPLQPLQPLQPQQPSQYHQFVAQNPQQLSVPQRHWQYYGSHHPPPGVASSVSTSPWNPYNPLLDNTLHQSVGVGQAQVGVATSIVGHGPGANVDASKSEPAPVPIRCLIVNGSKRRYDVDMLNRLAWGDLATSPAGAEAALCADDAVVDADAGASSSPVSLELGVSLPSMVSDHGTLTCQSSLASVDHLQAQPLVPSLTETAPVTALREGQAQAEAPAEAQTSTALTTTSVAHHWLLKLPPAFWQRLAQYVDDETLSKLSTINRVFAHARVERVLRSKKREARLERADKQVKLEKQDRLERLERVQRLERLDKMARLAEQEERTTFVASQLDRLSLSPTNSHQSGSSGVSGSSGFSASSRFSAFSAQSGSSSRLIHGQWPRCPKACFRCFRVRQQAYFPRVLVLSAAGRAPQAGDMDETPMAADVKAALGTIVARYLESKSQAEPLAERRHHMMCRPMFVPYIPIPADVADVASANVSTAGADSRGKAAETPPVPTSETAPAEEEPSHFDRCCFECAISAGLIKPGERVLALDGSWRWVCRYGLAHAGGNDDICAQCHDEV